MNEFGVMFLNVAWYYNKRNVKFTYYVLETKISTVSNVTWEGVSVRNNLDS